jgi:hypothetical protein
VQLADSNGRGGGIRTPDPLLPKQMRYQTALRPDGGSRKLRGGGISLPAKLYRRQLPLPPPQQSLQVPRKPRKDP